MGILGGIKDRILRRKEEDLEDFRSHVLGQQQGYQAQEPEPEPPKKLYERELPMQNEVSPFGFKESEPATQEVSQNYEIMDRLNICLLYTSPSPRD